ncbi:MAG: multiheme c-type cytochrome [Thiovulaceae bacterium]|nr:multiheme c-type cytochrome [Sulfurimonadaceae bacterium]
MKILWLFVLSISFLSGANAAKVVQLDDKFAESKNCKACHLHLVKDWQESWHSKSHFDKDEYFRKSIKYYSRKTRKSLNGVKVECATCHNPRISVTSTDINYEIEAVLGLDKGSKVNKALKADALHEGINCVVCHNIDKIHSDKDEKIRGINRVTWTKSGLMSGPYEDAKSPYHNVEYRDFMSKNSNQLCFVCHANMSSVKNIMFSNMEKEFKSDGKMCVDCHMGPKKLGVASTLKIDDGEAKKRMIRKHGFKGAHDEDMIKNSLKLSTWQKGEDVVIMLKNPQPHNIPTGYGSREILIELEYKKGSNKIKKEEISLTTHYKDRRKRPTIAHLAKTMSKDMSVPAQGKKVIKVKKVDGASDVKISVYYKLVNDEVHELLKLKEKRWSKKMLITRKSLKLK